MSKSISMIGWREEHRNNVARRWKEKFQQSEMTADEFTQYMEKIMLDFGWTKSDIKEMIKIVIS